MVVELAPDAPLPPVTTADAEQVHDAVVIGAGVIGLSIALRLVLANSARRVLVLERDSVAAGASRGNAGAYAFSDIEPLASPGILRKVPRWLFNPLGPLSLRPGYLPTLAPWLWRFWRASQPARVSASTTAQTALNRLSAAATLRLLDAVDATSMLHQDGNLHLYESTSQWKASLRGWEARRAHGIDFEHAHGPHVAERIAQWQPGLAPGFAAATFVPGWATIDDPHQLVRRIAGHCASRSVRFARATAKAITPLSAVVAVQLDGGCVVFGRHVVIAAGAWSHHLTHSLGDDIPLETERGYNTTLPPGAFDLRRQLTFPAHGFVVTPVAGGVRVGGAVELAGLNAPPNYQRSDAMLTKAKRFLPALKVEDGTRWMGFRPSLPDSLPVIGPARKDSRVLYAFGHGHLGLTQSAATAEIVEALIAGQTPTLDIAAFSPRRFV
ncbi:MAG: FAD-binding oxidoreductase [Betaproteobacteria bacterium]|nr:FAD-binding oxidoreductase [Betaproteobacteria bacterium]